MIYTRWEDVPKNLKTRSALKQMGLKPRRGQKPAATKTHWNYKVPDYALYDVSEAVPHVVTDKQRAALEKARQKSVEQRTCKQCGWVEDLSKHYRGKWYISGGLCPHCREQESRKSDKDEAVIWAQQVLSRDDVLILDTETTDLDGEIIELAIINLEGEPVYNGRFNPLTPVSDGARAVHGITDEMLADEPRFADCKMDVFVPLLSAGLVLIYNRVFDLARLRQTCKLHGVDMPTFQSDCLMEWYAQFINDWSDYHQSYRWQPLSGGHSALSDCLASLEVLKEMATSGD